MFVSIIVPALNEADRIEAVLARLQAICDQGFEIIVVDGGSSDDTCLRVIGCGCRLLHSEPGRARQMNAGAKAADGDVLWFIHADTLVPHGALAALRDSEQSWGRFDVSFDSGKWGMALVAGMMNLRSCLTGIATGDQALFVRRETFESVAGFADIPLMEDIALSRRLKKVMRPDCVHLPVCTSARRWQRNGLLRTVVLMWWLRLAFFVGVPAQRLARWYR